MEENVLNKNEIKGISLEEFRKLLKEDKEETVKKLNDYLSTLSNSTSKDFEAGNEYDFSYSSLSKCMLEAGYRYTKKAFEKIPGEQKEEIIIEKKSEAIDELDELAEVIVHSVQKEMVQTSVTIEKSTKEKISRLAKKSSLSEAEIIRRLININLDKLASKVELLENHKKGVDIDDEEE